MSDALNDLDTRIALMRENLGHIENMNPWGRTLGFRTTRVEHGHVWGEQDYDEKLIADPDTGVLHGGVITTFLDNLCGMSCSVAMEEFRFVATLDLRIDYMRPAEKGLTVHGEAECYHLTKSVAFTRAWAYHETKDNMIAMAQGAFAITHPRPLSQKDSQ